MIYLIMNLVPLLVAAAFYAWFGLKMGKLFAQLGVEPWKAWVPIINQLEMLKLVNRPSSQIVIIAFIPLYGLLVYYQVLQEMTRLCGRDEKLALLGLILPPVWAGKMMDDDGAAPKGKKAKDDSRTTAPPPPGADSMFGPAARSENVPGHMPVGYPPSAGPAHAPGGAYSDPYASAAPAAPQQAVATMAWPSGGDQAWGGSVWSASAPPAQGAAPQYAAVQTPPAPAAAPPPATTVPPQSSPQVAVQPPQMPVQPTSPPAASPVPLQPGPPPVAAQPALQPVAAQPAPQPVMAQPVLLPAASPSPAQPAPQPFQPSPQQPVMAQPTLLPAASPASVQPDPQPTRPALRVASAPAAPSQEPVEYTVLIDRAASQSWSLVLDDGRRFDLWAPSVVIGRAPSSAGPGAQVLAVSDETCTISKVHARLDLVDGAWQITDAGSTNGIIVTHAGRAYTVPSGTSAAVDEQFVLGSVGMRLVPGEPLPHVRA